jgi:hypothetical protein
MGSHSAHRRFSHKIDYFSSCIHSEIAGRGFIPDSLRGLNALVAKAIRQTRVAKLKQFSWQGASMISPRLQLLELNPRCLADLTILGELCVICNLILAAVPSMGLAQIAQACEDDMGSSAERTASHHLSVYSNNQVAVCS